MFLDSVLVEFAEKVDRDYRAMTPGSARLADDMASTSCPGGDYRSMVWFEPYPVVMDRGEGCYLVDVDGNKYLDLVNNWTSMVLGNNPPEIVDAVKRAVEQQGMAMAAPTESAYRWAELICERVSSVERVRFACSGSEATMFALRTARAFTGKEKVIKLSGGFHGSYDPLHIHVGWGEWPAGLPKTLRGDIVMVPPNDIAATEEIILANKDDCAAVILEAVMAAGGCVPLTREYLEFMRGITADTGLLLIMDEVVTLRFARGGAQEVFDIDADLTAFGKAIGGGMPGAAFGGRADIMELYSQASQEDPIYHSGTFIATPAVAAAGIASLEAMTKAKLERINILGETLADGVRGVLRDHGIKAQVTGFGSLCQLHWREAPLKTPEDAEDQVHELKPIFNKLMMKRGFFTSVRNLFILTTPMGLEEVDATLKAVSETLDEMKPLIEHHAPQLI